MEKAKTEASREVATMAEGLGCPRIVSRWMGVWTETWVEAWVGWLSARTAEGRARAAGAKGVRGSTWRGEGRTGACVSFAP